MKTVLQFIQTGIASFLLAAGVFILPGCGHSAIPSDVAPSWNISWDMSPAEVEEHMAKSGELTASSSNVRRYHIYDGFRVFGNMNGQAVTFHFDRDNKLYMIFLVMDNDYLGDDAIADAAKKAYGPVMRDSINFDGGTVSYPLAQLAGHTRITLTEIPDPIAERRRRFAIVILSRR